MYIRRASLLIILQLSILVMLQGQENSNGEITPPATPPPPPPPPNLHIEELGLKKKTVRFPECNIDSLSQEEVEKCEREKMIEFVYKNLEYPKEALKNKVEGMVFVQFVIEKDGSIGKVKVLRDIGAGCGEAAKQVIEKLKSLPVSIGHHYSRRGGNAKDQITLPIRFKLP